MADLVVRIVEDQRHFIQLVGGAQPLDEQIEQLVQRASAQQLEFAFLGLAQQRVVAADFDGERGQPCLQQAVLLLQLDRAREYRIVLGRLAVGLAHGAQVLLTFRRGAP